MADTRKPAKDVAQNRGNGAFWIDHAVVTASDLSWLKDAKALTLWNVSLPPGFLATLPYLEGLDWHGGSASSLALLEGVSGLGYLIVNQVRGLTDISHLASLPTLKLLSLYGLSKVTELPSLQPLHNLQRLELGQMKSLGSIGPALDAPNLRELLLTKQIGITSEDVAAIRLHKCLSRFRWDAIDVPNKVWEPVVSQVGLPSAKAEFPHEWYAANV
ncbi:hypothetical protein [Azospira oryzae]|uniref:hypothetical protein n=1 Tax=Azospira oryzae TaxID=146939 RepID=UPI00102BB702|nr:hypothetical protein [Azospira oryzae]